MEVRPGFKQTETGVIPEDWNHYTLEDACERISVGLATSVTQHYRDSGVPIVRNLNIKDGYFDGSDMLYITEQFAKANNSKAAKALDVLTVHTGSNLGDTCVLPEEFDNCQTFTTLITTPRKALLNPYYLSLHMGSPKGKKELARLQVGGGKGNLNTGDLKNYRVDVPPLGEQRAIAAALSDVDALLDGLTRLIAKKRDLKQATMQQLLTGQTRLPGFSGGWVPKTLGDLGSTYGGLTGKTKSDFGVGTARYITFMNVMTNVVIDCEAFDQVQVSSNESQNPVTQGDLLFNGSSETPEEVAFCSYMPKEIPDLFLNSFCFGFRLRDKRQVDGLFLSYYIRATPGRELMKSLAQGSTRYNLSKAALLQASLLLPPKEEQTAIATVLSDMDAELATLNARLAKTDALKQAMMFELLTGKTRLPT